MTDGANKSIKSMYAFMYVVVCVPSVFEDLDELDAPAGIDNGTEVVFTKYRDQHQVHQIQNIQLQHTLYLSEQRENPH